MNTGKPLVSILTPVYNGEKYLRECIESVISQTYDNFEYIIVDNCSTDSSPDIISEYAMKDPRIKSMRETEFIGAIANHNRALAYISENSKYVKIIQADDWMFPECIHKMVDVGERNPGVGLVSSYRLDDKRVNCDGLDPRKEVFSGKIIGRGQLKGDRNVFGSFSTPLYRRSLLSGKATLKEDNFHADTELCYQLLANSDFGFVHQVLTYTRRHGETITALVNQKKTSLYFHLYLMMEYGSVYYNNTELDELLNKYISNYYKKLAALKITGKKKAFRYNADGLKNYQKLSYLRLYSNVFSLSFSLLPRFYKVFMKRGVKKEKTLSD
jgi:glycosyltransferase involved in cell wall biosynthesis